MTEIICIIANHKAVLGQSIIQGKRIQLTSNLIQSGLQGSVRLKSQDSLVSAAHQVIDISSKRSVNRLLGLFGLFGIDSGGVAASQHGDSHDTGQHQGSNFS